MMADNNKQKTGKEEALSNAILQIERSFGKGSIMKMGSGMVQNVPSIPTGILSIDIITGIGGIPKGRVTEIFGEESSGKTTLALHCIASAQKYGGVVAFIDAEHALNPQYARLLGVNVDELLISQPDYGEQALDIAEMLVRSGAIDVVVIDSVAALVPKAELDGEMGDSHMGLQARLMSQALRKLTAAINKSNTSVIFINQVREKIGIVFGNPETTPGGKALKFYSSLRIHMKGSMHIKEGGESKGNKVKITIVKNKVASPFKSALLDVIYGEGISFLSDIIDLSVENSIIDKSGSWFSYGDVRLGQGKENVKVFLNENPKILDEITAKLKLKLGLVDSEKTDKAPKETVKEKN